MQWAGFGMVSGVCVITAMVVLYYVVSWVAPAGPTREIFEHMLACVIGVQVAMLYVRKRIARGG